MTRGQRRGLDIRLPHLGRRYRPRSGHYRDVKASWFSPDRVMVTTYDEVAERLSAGGGPKIPRPRPPPQ
jgi:hypothetical protein